MSLETIKQKIRTIENWPKAGIMFRDVTSLLRDADGFKLTMNALEARYKDSKIDAIAGIEARGFIFGAALADRLGLGFIPIRKKGKLPGDTISQDYELEYGTDTIEVHTADVKSGQNILLVDDLLATGGTALGASKLLSKCGASVHEACFIVNLPDLGGADKLIKESIKPFWLVEFEGD
ncbi:MAG: adenine phosphoribosyltransferase [Halobacteriovorax sp.]|nr:adenine phosphoribosyltransferase [Halobacteriovorax sp.]